MAWRCSVKKMGKNPRYKKKTENTFTKLRKRAIKKLCPKPYTSTTTNRNKNLPILPFNCETSPAVLYTIRVTPVII